jgi:hypothetical protein
MRNQVREIEQQYEMFAIRIKIIYFLIIMFTSYGPIAYQQQQQQQQQSSSSSFRTTNDADLYLFFLNEDTNEIQRTFLDLLNSELDFQKNTIATARISLLLKLEQFI